MLIVSIITQSKVALMQSGKPPIYEPGLAEITKSTIADKKLEFTTVIRRSF